MASSIPSTCKAAVAEKEKQPLVIKDVPVPQPKEGEILLKTIACGICHSDHLVAQGMMGSSYPIIPGHEVIGDVAAVGPGEKRWKVGQRVGSGWHGGHDFTCNECKRGEYQFCDNKTINGVMRDGAFAEYCIMRSEAIVELPKDIDPIKTAPLLCAGVAVFNGMRRLNLGPGSTVAIQGLGGLGHLAIQFARQMGYRTVALSSSAAKKDFASKLGAHIYLDSSQESHSKSLKQLGGANLIVVTAPNPKLIPDLLHGLAPRGKILILAPVGDIPINTAALISDGSSVHGWPSGHAVDNEDTIRFAQVHDINCMVEKFALKDVNEALEHMTKGQVRFRGVIEF